MTDQEISSPDGNILFTGPPFHIDVAALDARHPVHYSRRLLIFRCPSPEQRDVQLAAFKIGLQALVQRCPILGGKIVPLPAEKASKDREDWRTIVPGQGLELVVKDLRAAIPSFEELESANFPILKLTYNLLVPVPYGIGNARTFAACIMQFSAIEGGTIITWAMSHTVADGVGNNHLIRILSEETRNAQHRLSVPRVDETRPMAEKAVVGHDRTVLRNITSKRAFNIEDHPAFKWKTTPANPMPAEQVRSHPFEATSPETPILLRLSAASLAQMKSDASTPDAPSISTHDGLSALIWRSVMLIRSTRCSGGARAVPPSTVTNLFMPSDARRHLGLPPSYVGNAVYQLAASAELGVVLSPMGLQHGASALRRAITAVEPSLVASYMSKLKETWLGWRFMESFSTTGVAMGTDWTSGTLYVEDWGEAFGPLVRCRDAGIIGEGGCAILPKLPDGGAEVVVSVMPAEVDILRGEECFGRYLDAS